MTRQSGRTRHDNRDANETPIVDALHAAGYTVTRCKEPALDLFVSGHGRWAWLEVKNPARKTGREKAKAIGKVACKPGCEWHDVARLMGPRTSMLSIGQAKFIRANHGPGGVIAIVTTPAEALAACGVVT